MTEILALALANNTGDKAESCKKKVGQTSNQIRNFLIKCEAL